MSVARVDDALLDTYKRWPIEIVSGSGSKVVDSAGRTYIDLLGGIAVCAVGHCHPKVTEAIAGQSARLIHISNLYGTAPQKELASKLAELSGGFRSFFANSGAESVECALKLARKWGSRSARNRIVTTDNAFHGRTFGALAATAQPAKQQPFAPMLAGFTSVPFGDSRALKAALADDVAAVIIEPIQGESGVVVPPAFYLREVRTACDEAGALLIVDEIQTGLGRTGSWFAYEASEIVPDVICLAKALGGGLPIGVCLAAPQISDVLVPGDHGSTFGGGPVACAAALAVLDVIEHDGLVARAAAVGAAALKRLETTMSGCAVRGAGLLIGIELPKPVARDLTGATLEAGVLVNNATDNVIRLAPALNIPEAELDAGLSVLEDAWRAHAL